MTYKLEVLTVATVEPCSPAAVSPVIELLGIKATLLSVSLIVASAGRDDSLGTAKSEDHEQYRAYIFSEHGNKILSLEQILLRCSASSPFFKANFLDPRLGLVVCQFSRPLPRRSRTRASCSMTDAPGRTGAPPLLLDIDHLLLVLGMFDRSN